VRGIAILTVTGDVAVEDLAGVVVTSRVRETGHRIVAQAALARSEVRIAMQINAWLADPEIEIIIIAGATDTAEASTERHGSTWLFSLSGSLTAIADAFDRVVLPQLANRDRITTSSISVIGDLETPTAPIDLRAGKRGLVLLTAMGMAAAAAFGAVTVDAIQRNQEVDTSHHATASLEDDPAALPPTTPPPAHVVVKPPVPAPAAARAKPARPAPKAVATTRVRKIEKPAPEKAVVVPPALEAKPVLDQCSEVTCAASNNERECCAPYRDHPAKLERTMIAPVIASLKSKVLDCRETEHEGLVKLDIDVGADGHVTRAAVLESPEATVGKCVADTLRAARFRATEQGGSFVYRIDLAER
jgi:outer membrane biosynthesis protein TonB